MTPELSAAVRAADAAAAVLLAHHRTGVLAEWKGVGDPVTVADREAEQVIRSQLSTAFPDDLVVGEEGDEMLEARVAGRRRWYVDPLDGTANFLKGRRRWAVSIAFCGDDDEMAAAVVYAPVAGERFTAARGLGAALDGTPLRAADTTDLAEALFCAGPNAGSFVHGDVGRLWRAMMTGRITGSTALDLCDVACGRADVALGAAQGRWDTAAGGLIAAEAGASVTDGSGRRVPGPSEDLVAAAPGIADELLRVLTSG